MLLRMEGLISSRTTENYKYILGQPMPRRMFETAIAMVLYDRCIPTAVQQYHISSPRTIAPWVASLVGRSTIWLCHPSLRLSSPALYIRSSAPMLSRRRRPKSVNKDRKRTSLLFLPHNIRLCFLDPLELSAAHIVFLLLYTRTMRISAKCS